MIVIGYGGHAYVAIETLISTDKVVKYYCDHAEKNKNPYGLMYLGNEVSEKALLHYSANEYFVAIGDNIIRQKVTEKINSKTSQLPCNALSKFANISNTAQLKNGILIVSGSTVNALAQIGNGVIINTNASIDHECIIEDYAHIAPGAVLCGNVKVGSRSFIGANAVVKQGVTIGNDVIIGAGAVVIHDVEDNVTMVGNPSKNIKI